MSACPNCNHEEPIFHENGKIVACMTHTLGNATDRLCRECGNVFFSDGDICEPCFDFEESE